MNTFFQELFQVGIYKRSQGRIARQVTFASSVLVIGLGLVRLSQQLSGKGLAYQFALPGALLLASVWVVYRLMNVPAVADFLIAVEAEMNKVSWPTRTELFRASTVVLILIFFLGALLACYDMVWRLLLSWGFGIF